jgi:hypothetical protein
MSSHWVVSPNLASEKKGALAVWKKMIRQKHVAVTEQSLRDKERDMGAIPWQREMLLKIVADEDQIIKRSKAYRRILSRRYQRPKRTKANLLTLSTNYFYAVSSQPKREHERIATSPDQIYFRRGSRLPLGNNKRN